MTSEEQPPVIFPGQLAVDVDDEGDTVIRETLIPPPDRKLRTDQMTLGLAEGAI